MGGTTPAVQQQALLNAEAQAQAATAAIARRRRLVAEAATHAVTAGLVSHSGNAAAYLASLVARSEALLQQRFDRAVAGGSTDEALSRRRTRLVGEVNTLLLQAAAPLPATAAADAEQRRGATDVTALIRAYGGPHHSWAETVIDGKPVDVRTGSVVTRWLACPPFLPRAVPESVMGTLSITSHCTGALDAVDLYSRTQGEEGELDKCRPVFELLGGDSSANSDTRSAARPGPAAEAQHSAWWVGVCRQNLGGKRHTARVVAAAAMPVGGPEWRAASEAHYQSLTDSLPQCTSPHAEGLEAAAFPSSTAALSLLIGPLTSTTSSAGGSDGGGGCGLASVWERVGARRIQGAWRRHTQRRRQRATAAAAIAAPPAPVATAVSSASPAARADARDADVRELAAAVERLSHVVRGALGRGRGV